MENSPILQALKNGMNDRINPELVIMLIKIDGLRSNIVTLITNTDARLKKTGNPFGQVRKISKYQTMLNVNYESRVTKQLDREHKSASEYIRGKSTIQLAKDDNYNGCLAVNEKNGKLMLVHSPIKTTTKPETTYILENGQVIEKEKIARFIPQRTKPENQGTQKEIMWRNVYLENVVEIHVDGKIIKCRK